MVESRKWKRMYRRQKYKLYKEWSVVESKKWKRMYLRQKLSLYDLTTIKFSSIVPCLPDQLNQKRWAQFQTITFPHHLKEVRGSFAILFWLPWATWHRVMTHTHHTHFDRPTLSFATRRRRARADIRGLFRLSSSPQWTFFRFPGTIHGLHSN